MDWNILHYDVGESAYKYNPSDMYMCKCHMCKAKSYWLVTSKERIKGDIEFARMFDEISKVYSQVPNAGILTILT